MERELWTIIKWGLGRLPCRCPRNGVYTNAEILTVFLWAAMHNRPINASDLVDGICVERPTNLLADAGYDSNALHRACEASGIQLIAPRRRPGTGLGWVKGGHSAGRLRSIEITEGVDRQWDRVHRLTRLGIERFFGTLATPATGLFALPRWVRRLHRVRAWVAAKLMINAARTVWRREIHA